MNYVLPKDYTRHTIYVYTSDDTACRYIGADDDFYFHDDKSRTEYTRIYTDRAIYRPGQEVHVAGIIYARENYFETSVVAGKKVMAQLRDANYNIVAEQEAGDRPLR